MLDNQFQTDLALWKNGQLSDEKMALCFFLHCYKQEHPKTIYKTFDQSILTTFQFKKIKEKAIVCLRHWVTGHWTLKLVDSILSPFEVLAYQAQGIRPVTMLVDKIDQPVLHRKNALDFFCHDLEHGYMFFHDQDLFEMQKTFFNKIKDSLSTELWNECLADKNKRQKFYYLISDMNTHKEHYRAYLNCLIPESQLNNFQSLFI